MTRREIDGDDDAAKGGRTSIPSTNLPDDCFAEQITAEFTSRRHIRGVAGRWISTRPLGPRSHTYGLDRDGDGVGCE